MMGFIYNSLIVDIIAFLFILLFIFYLNFKYSLSYWARKGVTYIEPSVPFGNIAEVMLLKKHIGDVCNDIYNEIRKTGVEYGGLYIFKKPVFLPIDPELIKLIMTKEFQSFHDRGVFTDEENDPMTGHLFAISGGKWRKLRTKLSPTFTSGKMKMMYRTVVTCSEQLDETLENVTRRAEPIDIKDILARFTTDIIGSCAFGLECNSLKDPQSEFRRYGRLMFEDSWYDNARRLVGLASPSLLRVFKVPFIKPQVSKFFMNAVKQTVDYRETNNIHRKDFMNLLIRLKNNENIDDEKPMNGAKNEMDKNSVDTNGVNNSGEGITFNELAAQAFMFFAAGFETSSSTMTFCLYELALNIDIQDKVRDEIRAVLKNYDGNLTYEALMDLQYMDKVVKETLRKYPIVPILNRECVQEFKMPDSDLVIEKGTAVIIPVLGLHKNPKYYPDPERFDPERFSEDEKLKRHPYTYLPFGEGPRNCIGMRFGLLQSKVGLATLLKNYKFTLDSKTKQPLTMNLNNIILSTEGGIWLQCTRVFS